MPRQRDICPQTTTDRARTARAKKIEASAIRAEILRKLAVYRKAVGVAEIRRRTAQRLGISPEDPRFADPLALFAELDETDGPFRRLLRQRHKKRKSE